MLRAAWRRRPWWMNLLLAFCLYMALVAVPLDFFRTPTTEAQEVWFGVVLRGVAAKATEPLHGAIYAAGAWGFWKMRRWIWPWAALYAAQIAIGTIAWNFADPRGRGWLALPVGVLLLIPTIALWRSRETFAARGNAR